LAWRRSEPGWSAAAGSRASDGRYGLTPGGLAAHAALAERVQRVRDLMSAGVTAEEHCATVRVLRRMAGNLAGALEQR
jgi:DNA-binding MarR family transcriptional regulator